MKKSLKKAGGIVTPNQLVSLEQIIKKLSTLEKRVLRVWIDCEMEPHRPCKKRFPQELEHVIILYDGIPMEGFCRMNGKESKWAVSWFKQDGRGINQDHKVTHWQPFPKRPKR